jgi:uncharacterized membrane protein YfcA
MSFGASSINTLIVLFERNPFRDRPVIDWNLLLMLAPSAFLGSTLGSLCNIVLCDFVTSTLMIIVLSLSVKELFKQAKRYR